MHDSYEQKLGLYLFNYANSKYMVFIAVFKVASV